MVEPSQSAVEVMMHAGKTKMSDGDLSKSILPPLKTPPKHTKDYLPETLLTALTQAGKKFQDLGPNGVKKGKYTKKRTDNVWNHEKTREKFKHLTEQPICYCGAGRDISYLLDATATKNNNVETKGKQDQEKSTDEAICDHGKPIIPESIIPSEFQIKKHKGVVGLDIHDDKYTTVTDEHKDHFTGFPSMKPSGRQEALQLLQTMNDLLKKAGIDDRSKSEFVQTGASVDEPTQIEALLNLVKDEQKIYNIIFSEVIRQVSVECVERGAVLAELRKRYAKMLDKVPRQVKSLHEEVLAQRALDRRLTEELSRFKTSITLLTKELHEIHAHDEEVTRQAVETQAELNEALKESEKNASLLAEYHDLYELQRRRLDYQLSKLIEERDLWAGSAQMLSLKVTDRHNLVTVRRLHLYEKAWYKLANRFTVLLGSEDAKELQALAGYVHKWQETSFSFNERLCDCELETYRKMISVQTVLEHWSKKFERVVTPDEGTVNVPAKEDLQNLFDVLKSWEELFNAEVERFAGDVLLACEDDLLQLTTCMDNWIESAMRLFGHHPSKDGSLHPQKVAMMDMNKKVQRLHNQLKLRMSGENGLAKGYIYFINTLDSWVNKINILLNGGETMFDSEWVQLADFIQVQWPESLQKIMNTLSHEEDDEIVDQSPLQSVKSSTVGVIDGIDDMNKLVQKWLQDTINALENENTNMIEQVSTTHSNMIRWLITILIRMAPDNKNNDSLTNEVVEDKMAGLGAAILSESTSEAIINRGTMIFNWLRSLTDIVVACCKELRTDGENPAVGDGSSHKKDLVKIETECQGWMNTANLLIHELTGETIPLDDFLPPTSRKRKQEQNELEEETQSNVDRQSAASVAQTAEDCIQPDTNLESIQEGNAGIKTVVGPVSTIPGTDTLGPDGSEAVSSPFPQPTVSGDNLEMLIIGHDDNVKKKSMKDLTDQKMNNQPLNYTDSKSSSMSLEALTTLDQLQGQLMETEKRAQQAEERAFAAESALKEAEERVRALERSISKAESRRELQTPTSERAREVNSPP